MKHAIPPTSSIKKQVEANNATEIVTLATVIRQGRLFLRRWLSTIIVTALIFGLVTGFLVSRIEKGYESSIQLLVERPPSNPAETIGNDPSSRDPSFVESQIYALQSSKILLKVVNDPSLKDYDDFQRPPPAYWKVALGLAVSPDDPAVVQSEQKAEAYGLRTLSRMIDVSRKGESNVIDVSVLANSPEKAVTIAEMIGQYYIADRVEAQIETAQLSSQWLNDRAVDLRVKLSEAEDAVEAFRINNNLIAGQTGSTLSEQQVFELNSELIKTRAELAEKRASFDRAQLLQTTGGDLQTLPQLQQSTIIMSLQEELLAVTRRQIDLEENFGLDHPQLPQVLQTRQQLEDQLQSEVSRRIEMLGLEVETLQSRERLIQTALQDAQTQSGRENQSGVELRELERVAESYRFLYERYLSGGSIANEAANYVGSGISLIGSAIYPTEPVYPPSKVFIVFGILFGAGFGALFGFVREALRPGFVTARDAEATLNLPVLATIPKIHGRKNMMDLASDDPTSPFGEAVRVLRYALTKEAKKFGGNVILMTSATSDDSMSELVLAIGESADGSDLRVLIIDANMQNPQLSRLLEMTDEPGLSDILLGQHVAEMPEADDPRRGLFVTCAGSEVASPTDLLVGQNLRRFLVQARRSYDLVIVDGPPIADSSGASILLENCDAACVAVTWGKTPEPVVASALRRLDQAKVAGIVLTSADLRAMSGFGEDTSHAVRKGRVSAA